MLAVGCLAAAGLAAGQSPTAHPPPLHALTLRDFVTEACRHDSVFQEILIEELKLEYARTLALPPRDLVFSARGEYGLSLDGTQSPEVTLALDRLFPERGASASLRYGAARNASGQTSQSLVAEAGVDVARNAFGKSVRLLDRITGLETQVARHQIVEAYEDYLARLIGQYFGWTEAFAGVSAARSAVEEAEKLLQVIEKKRRSHVAYQVDVDKARFQLLGRQERQLEAERDFAGLSLRIAAAMRHAYPKSLYPDSAGRLPSLAGWRESTDTSAADLPTLDVSITGSRTDSILTMLEARDSTLLLRAEDDLLPSARLYGGLGWADATGDLAGDTRLFVGIDFGVSLGKSQDKARAQVARIDLEQRKLGSGGLRSNLRADLGELAEQIHAQTRAVRLARERQSLAEAILAAETREYSLGRTDINDLIQAQNTLQEIRFAAISHAIRYDALRVEWLRLTDRLVAPRDLMNTPLPMRNR